MKKGLKKLPHAVLTTTMVTSIFAGSALAAQDGLYMDGNYYSINYLLKADDETFKQIVDQLSELNFDEVFFVYDGVGGSLTDIVDDKPFANIDDVLKETWPTIYDVEEERDEDPVTGEPPVVEIVLEVTEQVNEDNSVTISGTAEGAAEVEITLVDPEGNESTETVDVDEEGNFEFTSEADLAAGDWTYTVVAKDEEGNELDTAEGEFTIEEVVDTEAPVLQYEGETTINVENGAEFTLPTVTATDNVDEEVQVTSVIKDAAGNVLEAIDTKVAGTYTITYSAVDAAGNAAEELVITVVVAEAPDTVAPVLTVNEDAVTVNNAAYTLTGSVVVEEGLTVTVNGQEVTVAEDGSFSAEVTLVEGENTITVVAKDAAGNEAKATKVVTLDTAAPTLTVDETAVTVNNANFTLTGSVEAGATVTVNGQEVTVAEDGSFSVELTLVEGENTITVVAKDAAGNEATASKKVTYEVLPEVTKVDATAGNDEKITVSGTVKAAEKVNVVIKNSAGTVVADMSGANAVTVTDGAFSYTTGVGFAAGTYTYEVSAVKGETTSEVKSGTVTVANVAPTLVSVQAVDNKHVKFTFSEPVNKSVLEAATVTDIFDVKTVAGGTTLTPVAASVLADGKTVLVTVTTAMTDFPGGYFATAKKAAGLVDLRGNQLGSDASRIFDGIGSASTIAPVALTATYDPSDSSKVIKVKFDKAISSTVDKTKIKVAGQALTINDTVERDATDATNRTLKITLSTATANTLEAATIQTVELEAGAVKDTESNPNSIEATTVSVVEHGKLLSAAYNEESNKLTLNFSKAVNISSIDLTKITLNGEQLAASSSTTNKLTQTSNSSALEFTLSDATDLTNVEGAATNSRGIVIASGFANDTNGNVIASGTYNSKLTYTDDVTAPTFTGASYNATTNQLTLNFSEPVSVTTDTMIEVYSGTTKLFDLNAAGTAESASGNNIVVTLSGAQLTAFESANPSTLSVKILKTTTAGTAAVTDSAGNKFSNAADATVNVNYVDQDAFTISGVTQTGVAADQIKVSFNKPLNADDIKNAAKFTVVKKNNTAVSVPVLSAVPSGDNRSVILTLDKNSPNYVNGYEYLVATTAKDVFGNSYAAPTDITGPDTDLDADFTLNTSVTATAFKLTGVQFTDKNSNYIADAGDKLTLTFDGVVSISGTVTSDDFAGTAVLGTGFTAVQGSTPESIEITLGTGANVIGKTINITTTEANKHIVGANGLKVVEGDSDGGTVGNQAFTIAKPDVVGPTITKVVYSDANANGTIDATDTLTITFSEDITKVDGNTINAVTTSAPNADFILAGGGTGLTLNSNAVSISGNVMTIALASGTNDFVPGTSTLNADQPDAVTDKWGNALTPSGTPVKIEKSDTTSPTFSNVSIVKGTGNTGATLEAGDKIVFSVSEAVQKDAALNVKAFVLYAGSTAIVYGEANNQTNLGFGGSGAGAAATNISIDNVAKTVTITVAANDGWVGATISAITSFNIDGLKTSLKDANENKIAPAAGFGLTVTKP